MSGNTLKFGYKDKHNKDHYYDQKNGIKDASGSIGLVSVIIIVSIILIGFCIVAIIVRRGRRLAMRRRATNEREARIEAFEVVAKRKEYIQRLIRTKVSVSKSKILASCFNGAFICGLVTTCINHCTSCNSHELLSLF